MAITSAPLVPVGFLQPTYERVKTRYRSSGAGVPHHRVCSGKKWMNEKWLNITLCHRLTYVYVWGWIILHCLLRIKSKTFKFDTKTVAFYYSFCVCRMNGRRRRHVSVIRVHWGVKVSLHCPCVWRVGNPPLISLAKLLCCYAVMLLACWWSFVLIDGWLQITVNKQDVRRIMTVCFKLGHKTITSKKSGYRNI